MASRRDFLRGSAGIALGALAAPLLDACGGSGDHNAGEESTTTAGGSAPPPPSGATAGPSTGASAAVSTPPPTPVSGKVQLTWWGGQERAKYTEQITKAYEKSHANTNIQTSFSDWGSYWQKVATQAAGHAIPDVLQMSTSYVGKYASAGQLLALDPYKAQLDVADTDEALVNGGIVNGKLYGIGTGGSMLCMVYNDTILSKTGLSVPEKGFTADEFFSFAKELQPKLPKDTWITQGYPANMFVHYIRQFIPEQYTPDGKIAFTKQQALDWINYWYGFQQAGLLLPNGKAPNASSGNPADSAFTLELVVFSPTTTNGASTGLVLMKGKPELKFTKVPSAGTQSGDEIIPAMLWSISANTKNPDLAVSLVNYLLHDPDAVKLTGLDRGIPGTPAARKLLEPTLPAVDQETVEFVSAYGPTSRAPKAGYQTASYKGEIVTALDNATQAVFLGKKTPAEAADSFWAAATRAEKAAGT